MAPRMTSGMGSAMPGAQAMETLTRRGPPLGAKAAPPVRVIGGTGAAAVLAAHAACSCTATGPPPDCGQPGTGKPIGNANCSAPVKALLTVTVCAW
jgi:hypothetical protein